MLLQDVARLVDLCRHNIIFNDTMDIVVCLRMINADPDIRVVRVKNRLDTDYKASISRGYRDVMINLQISNELTKALGVDLHVCEVQLIPQQFAQLKVHSYYSNYTIQSLNFRLSLSVHAQLYSALNPLADIPAAE